MIVVEFQPVTVKFARLMNRYSNENCGNEIP